MATPHPCGSTFLMNSPALKGLRIPSIQASPSLRVPVVARLVGRNAAEAQRILRQAQPGMLVTEDLAEALTRVDAILEAAA